jgi:hypothetical protein
MKEECLEDRIAKLESYAKRVEILRETMYELNIAVKDLETEVSLLKLREQATITSIHLTAK